MRKYILALAAVVAALHCKAGSSLQGDARAEEFCNAFCQCEGCTDTDRQNCIGEQGDLISEAQAARCDDELDNLFTCLGKDAFCDNGSYDTSTCRTEENVLSACISGSTTTGAGGTTSSASSSSIASTGAGASDGGTCATCSSVLGGAAPATICPASQSYLSSLLTCGCGVCAASCPGLCINQPDTTTCFSCLQSVCSAEYTACANNF